MGYSLNPIVVSCKHLGYFEEEMQSVATAAAEDIHIHRLRLWVSYATDRFHEGRTGEDGTFDRFAEWEWCVVHGHPCRARVGTVSYDSKTRCKTPLCSDLQDSTKCNTEPHSVDTMEQTDPANTQHFREDS